MLTLVADCLGRILRFNLRPDMKELSGGSLPDNSIYLPFKGISRHHFLVQREGRGWYIQDLGSRNGVSINGKKVTRGRIKEGDEIQAGVIVMKVESTAQDSAPLAIPGNLSQQTEDSGTDRVGHLPITDEDRMFSFPDLIFP